MVPTTLPPTVSEIETDGSVTIEWLYERHLFVYRNEDATRTGVDNGVRVLLNILNAWEPSRPYLAIYDAQHDKAILTPYARQKIQEASAAHAHIKGRTAILIHQNPMGIVLKLFIRVQSRNLPRVRQIFFSREDALLWLGELLPDKFKSSV